MYGDSSPMAFHEFGREWKNLRKSFLRGIKMYGTGLHELETLLADVLEELVEVIKRKGKQAFVIEEDIYKAVGSSMWLMVNLLWIAPLVKMVRGKRRCYKVVNYIFTNYNIYF